jgi:hypothetical protein
LSGKESSKFFMSISDIAKHDVWLGGVIGTPLAPGARQACGVGGGEGLRAQAQSPEGIEQAGRGGERDQVQAYAVQQVRGADNQRARGARMQGRQIANLDDSGARDRFAESLADGNFERTIEVVFEEQRPGLCQRIAECGGSGTVVAAAANQDVAKMADMRAVVGREGLRHKRFEADPARIARCKVFKLPGTGARGRAVDSGRANGCGIFSAMVRTMHRAY